MDKSRKVANMPIEETKEQNLKSLFMSKRRDESESPSEIKVNLEENQRDNQLLDRNQQ